MPRKSRAELGVVPAFKSEPVPVQPPETLSEPARKVFLDLVSHCNPTHFEQSDVTLLGQYAEASAYFGRVLLDEFTPTAFAPAAIGR